MIELTEGHTVRQFDGELAHLRILVLEMGGLVLDQTHRAVAALLTGDVEQASQVIGQDERVNAYCVRVDDESVCLIARCPPMAGDLRTIIALGKAITDLERVGAEAGKIARRALLVNDRTATAPVEMLRDVGRLGRLARDMLRGALQCFDRLDAAAGEGVAGRDALLDAELRAAMRRLLAFIAEDHRNLRHAINILFAIKSLERIGDHARNTAEHVVDLVQGRVDGSSEHPLPMGGRTLGSP